MCMRVFLLFRNKHTCVDIILYMKGLLFKTIDFVKLLTHLAEVNGMKLNLDVK